MPRRQPLSDRHVNVLRWIADGCPDREWPDESHKLSARALESRGLARVRRKGKLWHAVLAWTGSTTSITAAIPNRNCPNLDSP